MKKIMFGIMSLLLLILPLVRASTFVNENISTTGNLYYNSNLHGNNVDVTIDGLNWKHELNEIHYGMAHSFDVYSLTDRLHHISDWVSGRTNNINPDEYRIGYYLQTWLLPRQEYNHKINELEFRIKILENSVKLISEDAYCKGMQQTMLQYGLKNITCPNGITYYNIGSLGSVSIKSVNQTN